MNDLQRMPLRVDPAHPALAGHFPGAPLVPGVVLLERVAAAWKVWRGGVVGGLDAKFVQPLQPGQDALIELRDDGARVRFTVSREDGAVLARGVLTPVPSAGEVRDA